MKINEFTRTGTTSEEISEREQRHRILAREAAEESSVFDAFLNSKKFQEHLRTAVLDALRTPEGQALLAKAIRNSGK